MDALSVIRDIFEFAVSAIDKVPAVRAIIASLLVFFLPGFTWTLVFFRHVNHLERTVLSFGLSLAIVTLTIVFTNIVFHIKITGLSALLTIIVITVVPAAIYYLRKHNNTE